MIALHVQNSSCRITGLSDKQFRELRELLSYQIDAQARYFSGAHSGKRYLLGKRGDFPSGLKYIVENYVKENKLYCEVIDTRKVPKSTPNLFTLSLDVQPYPDQDEAVLAATSGSGVICMPTGCGKSLTMALLVAYMQLRTLIVVPNLELKRQLQHSFNGWFGDNPNVRVENIDCRGLAAATDYDLLIVDEAHHSAAATYRKLNRTAWKGIYHRFCFTATPFRSRNEEQLLMESVTGPVIYRLAYKTAVERGYIVPVEAYYVEVPKQGVQGYTWAEVYAELVTKNIRRNALVARIVQLLHGGDLSTLCLVKEIAHGEALKSLVDSSIPFIKGENADNREKLLEFNLREHPVLIGTTGVLGEGVDSKPCEYVIIAGLGKSRPAFLQQVGRAVRRHPGKESAKVIIFKDISHKFTKSHFAAQIKTLRDEFGVTPVKLEVC